MRRSSLRCGAIPRLVHVLLRETSQLVSQLALTLMLIMLARLSLPVLLVTFSWNSAMAHDKLPPRMLDRHDDETLK